jgi:hypothetical protein
LKGNARQTKIRWELSDKEKRMKKCGCDNKRGSGAGLYVLQTVPNASIQIGDSYVLPLEHPGAAGAGTIGLYFSLLTPSPYGSGVDVKDTGDIAGGQHAFFRLPVMSIKVSV